MNFSLGCAVWAYRGWVGSLFPPITKTTDFLKIYSRRLSTVEGNTTFYAVPSAEQVARWVEATPPGFTFCPKLHREISHGGPLSRAAAPTAAFVERMRGLGPRLGPMFLQLPSSYGPNQFADLEGFLATWPADLRLAVEVRHLGWYEPPGEQRLADLLDRYRVGRVLMDVRPLDLGPLPGADMDLAAARDRKPQVPLHPLRSGDISLLRYIGHPQLALNEPLLDEWARRIAAWLREGTTVYAFMHCPDEARSPELCRALYQRLAPLVPIPPLPWAAGDDEPPVQAPLF